MNDRREEAGEPMDVNTDKPLTAAEEPAAKELLPNSLAASSVPSTSEDIMQVDDELTSSADNTSDSDKLTM